jgi:hypothetical protein
MIISSFRSLYFIPFQFLGIAFIVLTHIFVRFYFYLKGLYQVLVKNYRVLPINRGTNPFDNREVTLPMKGTHATSIGIQPVRFQLLKRGIL